MKSLLMICIYIKIRFLILNH